MSATVLMAVIATGLVLIFALLVLVVCLMAGAARPLRRGSPPPALTDLMPQDGTTTWRSRPKSGRDGSRTSRRTGALRRSVHSLWRD